MRVLLTGAAGFIGSAIADALRAAGDEVVGIDAMIPQAHGDGSAPEGVHLLDVRDTAQWSDLLRGVDVVCHQAAMVGAGVDPADLPLYAGHNDLGTAALLAALADVGPRRLVQASSMVVYGEGRYRCGAHGLQEPEPRSRAALDAGDFDVRCPRCAGVLQWERVPESAVLRPRSAYAASKVAQEHYASAWAAQADGRVVSLRYHNVYGPGMPRDTPYSGVAAMFRSRLEAGDAPRVFEDGTQLRDFVHVADVARANVLALHAVLEDATAVRAYNVCSGVPVSIGDVARAIASGTTDPREPVVTGQYRLGDVRHVVASPELATAELGFEADVGPWEGLRAFAVAPMRG